MVGIGNDGVGKTCLVKNFCEKKVYMSFLCFINIHTVISIIQYSLLKKFHSVLILVSDFLLSVFQKLSPNSGS